jgi:hypothetical protein
VFFFFSDFDTIEEIEKAPVKQHLPISIQCLWKAAGHYDHHMETEILTKGFAMSPKPYRAKGMPIAQSDPYGQQERSFTKSLEI